MRADVVVVGGGPAGCLVSGILAKRGFNVVVVEEHGEVGNPACCTGIVGVEGLKEVGIKPSSWVLEKLRGAVIYPPSNEPVELTRGKVEAFVIDRAEFDRSLSRDAAKSGAKFLFRSRCVGVKLGRSPVVQLNGVDSREINARLVIGADGPSSIVASKAGLIKSNRYTKCAQTDVVADVRKDAAEIYLGRSFAPGFFGWIVKAGDVCRVGLGTTEGNPLHLLRAFIERHPMVSKKVKSMRTPDISVGLIPESFSRRQYANRVLLVGDAAGQVKPLTGGGIYIGLSCAKLAADVAARALGGEPDEKSLHVYDTKVREKFGRELDFGARARKAFDQMPDEDIDAVLGTLRNKEVRDLVLKNFDFDYHGVLVKALMRRTPSLLRELGLKRVLKYTKILMGH